MSRLKSLLRVAAALALAIGVTACGEERDAPAAAGIAEPAATPLVREVSDGGPLDTCSRPNVSYEEAEAPAAARAKGDELRRNESSPKSKVFYATVTIGEGTHAAKTSADAAKDDRGEAITDRPAWVVASPDERVSIPVGNSSEKGDSTGGPTVTGAGYAEVYDASTGELLRGWICGTRIEYPDGRVEVTDAFIGTN